MKSGVYSQISQAPDGFYDAFGRLRVSQPTTLFDSQMQYDTQPLLWSQKLVGTASVTHRPLESAADFTLGTASGDSVIRQTRQYFRYQPGKSQYVFCTGAFGEAQDGTTKLIGYGDDKNGIFFGQDGGGLFVLLRSNITGTPSDARKVYQADWSLDPLDGSGTTGLTIDATKAQIFALDIEWLGVGRVRIGVVIGGALIYCHEFLNANLNSTTYMTTANLPVRYEITNTAAVAAAPTLKQICCQVSSEGGQQRTAAYPFGFELTDIAVPVGSANRIVIFAARHKELFNGIENRVDWRPIKYDVLPVGGRCVTQIVYNPIVTGGTWIDIDSGQSAIEGNITPTGFSGGIVVASSLSAGGSTKAANPVFSTTASASAQIFSGTKCDEQVLSKIQRR